MNLRRNAPDWKPMPTTLSIIEEQALRHFLARMIDRFGKEYLYSVLFGSKARGDYHGDSDLDVAVFLKHVDSKIKREIYDLACEECLETDVEIAPLVFDADAYERMKAERSPIAREIERDKVLL